MRNVLAPLEANEAFVSTGQLPDPEKVTAIVTEAYEPLQMNSHFASVDEPGTRLVVAIAPAFTIGFVRPDVLPLDSGE